MVQNLRSSVVNLCHKAMQRTAVLRSLAVFRPTRSLFQASQPAFRATAATSSASGDAKPDSQPKPATEDDAPIFTLDKELVHL
ncbi:hypothetical protein BC830DRAFT_1172665 [Chytriomyces sp. MP71]|nr:hypothetical protein BC830DRAFT_1172665 [Chytriomyces sp. MP71]